MSGEINIVPGKVFASDEKVQNTKLNQIVGNATMRIAAESVTAAELGAGAVTEAKLAADVTRSLARTFATVEAMETWAAPPGLLSQGIAVQAQNYYGDASGGGGYFDAVKSDDAVDGGITFAVAGNSDWRWKRRVNGVTEVQDWGVRVYPFANGSDPWFIPASTQTAREVSLEIAQTNAIQLERALNVPGLRVVSPESMLIPVAREEGGTAITVTNRFLNCDIGTLIQRNGANLGVFVEFADRIATQSNVSISVHGVRTGVSDGGARLLNSRMWTGETEPVFRGNVENTEPVTAFALTNGPVTRTIKKLHLQADFCDTVLLVDGEFVGLDIHIHARECGSVVALGDEIVGSDNTPETTSIRIFFDRVNSIYDRRSATATFRSNFYLFGQEIVEQVFKNLAGSADQIIISGHVKNVYKPLCAAGGTLGILYFKDFYIGLIRDYDKDGDYFISSQGSIHGSIYINSTNRKVLNWGAGALTRQASALRIVLRDVSQTYGWPLSGVDEDTLPLEGPLVLIDSNAHINLELYGFERESDPGDSVLVRFHRSRNCRAYLAVGKSYDGTLSNYGWSTLLSYSNSAEYAKVIASFPFSAAIVDERGYAKDITIDCDLSEAVLQSMTRWDGMKIGVQKNGITARCGGLLWLKDHWSRFGFRGSIPDWDDQGNWFNVPNSSFGQDVTLDGWAVPSKDLVLNSTIERWWIAAQSGDPSNTQIDVRPSQTSAPYSFFYLTAGRASRFQAWFTPRILADASSVVVPAEGFSLEQLILVPRTQGDNTGVGQQYWITPDTDQFTIHRDASPSTFRDFRWTLFTDVEALEEWGTASISGDTDTEVTVNHSAGLIAGEELIIIPTSEWHDVVRWGVGDFASNEFKIHVDQPPGAGNTISFHWRIVKL